MNLHPERKTVCQTDSAATSYENRHLLEEMDTIGHDKTMKSKLTMVADGGEWSEDLSLRFEFG